MNRFGSVGWSLIALAFVAVVVGGCGGDGASEPLCPEDPQEPIARLKNSLGAGIATDSLGFVYFTVDYSEEPNRPVLCDFKITDGDSLVEIELSQETSDSFDEFMTLLTNGFDNSIGMVFSSGGRGWSIGGPQLESRLLYDVSEYTGFPDLRRQEIGRVTLAVTRAQLDVPGRDPSGDGRWMDIRLTTEIRFWGPTE